MLGMFDNIKNIIVFLILVLWGVKEWNIKIIILKRKIANTPQ
jgi:hypothetical protein